MFLCCFEFYNQECNIEETSDDDAPAKSSKDRKANAADSGNSPHLIFKITSKVPYKTVMKGDTLIMSPSNSCIQLPP